MLVVAAPWVACWPLRARGLANRITPGSGSGARALSQQSVAEVTLRRSSPQAHTAPAHQPTESYFYYKTARLSLLLSGTIE